MKRFTIGRIGFALLATGAICLSQVAGSSASGNDRPPLPAGCSFNQATGVLTCVSTTTSTSRIGPFTTNGFVAGSTTFGGFSGAQVCTAIGFRFEATLVHPVNVFLDVTTATTTTTKRHGLRGSVFHTSTSTSQSLRVFIGDGGQLGCSL